MTLLDVIQEAIRQNIAAAQLTDMVTGTVVSVDPLEIQTDTTQASLKQEVLVLTESVFGVSAVQSGNVLDISDSGLSLGDKVILLRVQHGQRFIVLSRAN